MSDLHCPRCGYSLRGNTSGRCPECGEPAGVREITERLTRLRLNWERSYRLSVRVVGLQSFAFILLSLFTFDKVPVWGVIVALAICLATSFVAGMRLGFDRVLFIVLEASTRRGRPTRTWVQIMAIVVAIVCVVGLQLFFLAFGTFLVISSGMR